MNELFVKILCILIFTKKIKPAAAHCGQSRTLLLRRYKKRHCPALYPPVTNKSQFTVCDFLQIFTDLFADLLFE